MRYRRRSWAVFWIRPLTLPSGLVFTVLPTFIAPCELFLKEPFVSALGLLARKRKSIILLGRWPRSQLETSRLLVQHLRRDPAKDSFRRRIRSESCNIPQRCSLQNQFGQLDSSKCGQQLLLADNKTNSP